MVKNYIIDLREITESIFSDLSGVPTCDNKDVDRLHPKDDRSILESIHQICKEYIWYRLTDSFKSLPGSMANTFYALVHKTFSKPEESVDETVERILGYLTTTEELFNDFYEHMPLNEWTTVDVDFIGDMVSIRFGKDLRIAMYESQHGTNRWQGEFQPVPDNRNDAKAVIYASLSHSARICK